MKHTLVRIVPTPLDVGEYVHRTKGTQVITDSGDILPVTRIVLIADVNDNVWRAELTMLVTLPQEIIALLSDTKAKDDE